MCIVANLVGDEDSGDIPIDESEPVHQNWRTVAAQIVSRNHLTLGLVSNSVIICALLPSR